MLGGVPFLFLQSFYGMSDNVFDFGMCKKNQEDFKKVLLILLFYGKIKIITFESEAFL